MITAFVNCTREPAAVASGVLASVQTGHEFINECPCFFVGTSKPQDDRATLLPRPAADKCPHSISQHELVSLAASRLLHDSARL